MTGGPPCQGSGPSEAAPPYGILRWFGLADASAISHIRVAGMVVMVIWYPPLLITLLQQGMMALPNCSEFLNDVAAHLRLLIAAPLLVVAHGVCSPRLNVLMDEFLAGGLVSQRDRGRHQAAIHSTRILMRSRLAGLGTIVLSYCLVAWAIGVLPGHAAPAWYRSDAGSLATYPWAAWWYGLVSLPLVVMLLLGWAWQLLLWTRFLTLMSRLELQVTPFHPDQAGGIGFVGVSARAFAIVALAVSVILVGPFLDRLVGASTLLLGTVAEVLVTILLVVCLFTAPLAAFMPLLVRTWWQGRTALQKLASRLSRQLQADRPKSGPVSGDLARGTDLLTITQLQLASGKIWSMRLLPIDGKSIVILILAAASPFLVAALFAVHRSGGIGAPGELLF